jgi:hypothetical protein
MPTERNKIPQLSILSGAFSMPVLTRNMRRNAGLPDLPAHFPVDVPPIVARPPSSRSQRPKGTPTPVPRSTLRIASPIVLSSPTRFSAPSPFASSACSESTYSRSSSYSPASTPSQDPPLSEVHPGVRRQQHQPEPKWDISGDRESVRMCGPPIENPRPIRPHGLQERTLFGKEWSMLSDQADRISYGVGSRNGSRASSESDVTVRGTPSVSSQASTFVGRPDKESRVSRRQPGVFKQ